MSVDLTDEDLAGFATAVERADGLHVHYDIDYSGVDQEGTITGPTLDIEAAVNLLRWAPWALQALRDARAEIRAGIETERSSNATARRLLTDERAENERLRRALDGCVRVVAQSRWRMQNGGLPATDLAALLAALDDTLAATGQQADRG